jgi:hypothetical protein
MVCAAFLFEILGCIVKKGWLGPHLQTKQGHGYMTLACKQVIAISDMYTVKRSAKFDD